jgi:hypothetical protein
MNRKQIIILVTLGVLVLVVFCGLGYAVLSTASVVDIPPVIAVGDPHKSPKRIALTWLDTVAARRCREAKEYMMPDVNESPFCKDDNEDLWLTQAEVDQVDVDESKSPLLGDCYIVTFYGDFGFIQKVTPPPDVMYSVGDPTPTPRPSYEQPLENSKFKVLVEEIDGRYYVSSWTDLLNIGIQLQSQGVSRPMPSSPTPPPPPFVTPTDDFNSR